MQTAQEIWDGPCFGECGSNRSCSAISMFSSNYVGVHTSVCVCVCVCVCVHMCYVYVCVNACGCEYNHVLFRVGREK
jgi:hypothetical protein